jgi:hypothetical protein
MLKAIRANKPGYEKGANMSYHIEAEKVDLDDLQKRIEASDLIPSRVSLLNEIEMKVKALRQQGIKTLAQLRNELKNSKRLEAVASATGIKADYLILLRREIEGYFPKPFALSAFDWLPRDEIAKLEQNRICDTAVLYAATRSAKRITELAKSTGVAEDILEALARLADLTRIQWVSPTVARMLVATACDGVTKVAEAKADELYAALVRVNAESKFFKGTIGLRDVKRLIQAASYCLS